MKLVTHLDVFVVREGWHGNKGVPKGKPIFEN